MVFRTTVLTNFVLEWYSLVHRQIQTYNTNPSPVLAFGIKIGCGSNDITQYLTHFLVYWVSCGGQCEVADNVQVGPCLGSLLAGPIATKLFMADVKQEKEEKKIQ